MKKIGDDYGKDRLFGIEWGHFGYYRRDRGERGENSKKLCALCVLGGEIESTPLKTKEPKDLGDEAYQCEIAIAL